MSDPSRRVPRRREPSMMRSMRAIPILLLALGLAAAPWTHAGDRSGGGDRTGGSRASGVSRTTAPRAGKPAARPVRARSTVSGRATYGHGLAYHHRGHRGYGWYGWPWVAGVRYPGAYHGWGPAPGPHGGSGPAAVETDVRPRRATVRVDGETVGQARDYSGRWDLLWLEPGEHVIEFERVGYRTLRRNVDLSAGGYVRIVERLSRGEGIDPRSSIARPAPRPRGAPAGTAPAGSAGTGALRRGLLRLDVEPRDAVIYLDGEFLGRASELARLHGALPLASGDHVLEIVRPGFHGYRETVTIPSQREPVVLEIDLEAAN